MNPTQENFDDLQLVDVRITDIAALPPTYFLRQSVRDSIQKEVRRDVLGHNKPVPVGAQGVYRKPTRKITGLTTGPQPLSMWFQLPSTKIVCALLFVSALAAALITIIIRGN